MQESMTSKKLAEYYRGAKSFDQSRVLGGYKRIRPQ